MLVVKVRNVPEDWLLVSIPVRVWASTSRRLFGLIHKDQSRSCFSSAFKMQVGDSSEVMALPHLSTSDRKRVEKRESGPYPDGAEVTTTYAP